MFIKNVLLKIKEPVIRLIRNIKMVIRALAGKNEDVYKGSGLRPLKPANRILMFIGKPGRILSGNLRQNGIRLVLVGCLSLVLIIFGLSLPKLMARDSEPKGDTGNETDEVHTDLPLEPAEEEEEQEQPAELPVLDISGGEIQLESSMLRINEPTVYGREVIYSAGNNPSIDEPVFTKLFIYNLDTGEEKVVCETDIKFGEIYEGRFNENWIVWLDTNQSGTNNICAQNRKTGEIFKIKSCNLNKPQLVLFGDNLVWVEQKNEEEDRLYLYNFKSGEPVSLESFNNPTYGTCSPALYNNVLVWVYPHPQDSERSIIKKLDLEEALFFNGSEQPQSEMPETSSEEESPDDAAQQMDNEASDGNEPETGDNSIHDDQIQVDHYGDEAIQPQIIDPDGFAIYPQTNGEVIAWLDNLDPSRAQLKMTKDDGETITVIAENVGRLFGVGDKFVVYTQNDAIMVYFWESGRYARLTAPGEKGMLVKSCVSGNAVVWCNADNPNQQQDCVKISMVEHP
ncbi:MAG: hypothetical protein GX024_10220 [Clostridiales bacterium]|nr:hypothetical protein [Clostridiales bacterium]